MPSNVLGSEPTQPALSHWVLLRQYAILILSEWGMAYWVWVGVHLKGGHLRDLTGGRWTSWRSVALDVAIAIPFCGVWELTAWLVHLAVERVPAATASYQPPSGFMEVFMWILLSVSAGICEEIVFRGYLQQQFGAATRSLSCGRDPTGCSIRPGPHLSGLEAGNRHCAAGNSLWVARDLAPQFARQHDFSCCVRHF